MIQEALLNLNVKHSSVKHRPTRSEKLRLSSSSSEPREVKMPIGSGAKGWPTGLFSHGMWLIWVLLPLVSACGRTVSPRKLSKWLPCNEVWLPTAAELSGGQTKRRMVAAALSSRSMQTSFFLCPSALLGPLLDTDRTLVKGHSYKILFDIFLTSSSPSEGLKIRGCQYYLVGIICPLWLRYTVNVLSAKSTDECLRTKSQDN